MQQMRDWDVLVEHTGASILADHPDGLSVRELWAFVVQRLPWIEQWYDEATGGSTSASVNFSYKSTGLVKAGLIAKYDRRWHLTSVGRAALEAHSERDDFYRLAHEAYRYWERNRERFDAASDLIEGIPDETWVSAEDLASDLAVDLERLLGWLQGARPTGGRRCSTRTGIRQRYTG
ncbi:hypothetical protein BJF79_13990 [Actinomadura sp. CNU-125]|nr:hypothetical protein BJF79_13990 [Actinomadura sp. CNU-125]